MCYHCTMTPKLYTIFQKEGDFMKISELFDLNNTIAKDYLINFEYPWEALSGIKDYIISLGKQLPKDIYEEKGENIWIAKNATVAPTAFLGSPCIIGENSEIRHCAFIRGSALIGNNCVVGNSTEMKNSIIFNNVQIPHFNYVGDSILGYKSHLGAGAITSNVKSDKTPIRIKIHGNAPDYIDTGMKKFGAIVGDYVEVGCNSVLCPGTVIGKNSTVYPLSRVRGYIRENTIYKSETDIVNKRPQ